MTTWTHLGEHLPWLRGQAIHVAEERSSVTLADTLVRAGFTVAVAEPGYPGIAAALKLPAKADSNLDALAEALQNLPARWPGQPGWCCWSRRRIGCSGRTCWCGPSWAWCYGRPRWISGIAMRWSSRRFSWYPTASSVATALTERS